jgi:hypothetical protein
MRFLAGLPCLGNNQAGIYQFLGHFQVKSTILEMSPAQSPFFLFSSTRARFGGLTVEVAF